MHPYLTATCPFGPALGSEARARGEGLRASNGYLLSALLYYPFSIDACAIITGNFLASLRTLVSSYRKHNPDGRFFVLLLDEAPAGVDLAREPFTVIRARDLGITELDALTMLYSAYELSMALRPTFLLYLQKKYDSQKLVFLDSDLFFTGNLNRTEKLLDTHAIILTPSFLEPIPEDGHFPSDRDFLAAGIFNGGFFACRLCDETTDILEWLSERLKMYAFYRPEESMFGDKKWLDMLPALSATLHVLRDVGYNVSHWNLHERSLTEKSGQYNVNDEPLIFYHFSGFDPSNVTVLSRHQNRFVLDTQPALQKLCNTYRTELLSHDYETLCSVPYSYGSFPNGVRISPVIRRIYEAIEGPKKFLHPFTDGFFSWMTSPAMHLGKKLPLQNVHIELWKLSVEAQAAFPKPATKNLSGFCRWMLRDRAQELHLDAVFTNVIEKYIDDSVPREPTWKLLLRKRHTNDAYQKLCHGVKAVIGRKIYDRLKPARDPMYTLRLRIGLMNRGGAEGVNLLSSLSGETGIAEGARGVAAALQAVGVQVRHIDTRATPNRQGARRVAVHDAAFDTSIVIGGLDEIAVAGIPDSGHVIGYIPWELQEVPERYRDLLEQFDEIWTLSTFSANALSRSLRVPVIRMPLVADVSGVSATTRSDFGIPSDVSMFLFVFDFHSRIERKNPEGLITSFIQSFGQSKDVLLVISATHGNDFPDELRVLQSLTQRHANIRLLTDYLPRPDLLALMKCADCYVSLHRSEGFGLTIAESMALGIPVIATDYGGSTDFLDASTGYPVAFSLTKILRQSGPYPAGAVWAEPDIDEASSFMNHVLQNPHEAKKKAACGKARMEKEYGKIAVGERLKERHTLIRSLER